MGILLSVSNDNEGKIVLSLKKGDKQTQNVFWDFYGTKLGKKVLKKLGVFVKKTDPKNKGSDAWTIQKVCDSLTQKEEFLSQVRQIKGFYEDFENKVLSVFEKDNEEENDDDDVEVI